MSSDSLLQRIHELNDLELALLLCLIANEHCIIHTEQESVEDLTEELKLVRPSMTVPVQ